MKASEFTNYDQCIDIAKELIMAFKRSTKEYIDVQNPEAWGNDTISAGVRYWGKWVMPQDGWEDGDEEDYDWEELTDESAEKANNIVQNIATKYPDFNIRWSPEEKNWIQFEVSKK